MKDIAEEIAISKLPKLSKVARDDSTRKIEEPGVNFSRFMYAKSTYLLELFKSFEKAEESHYMTYSNEEISKGNVSEISVVKKMFFDDIYNAYSEVITSRLYNYFGIPTTFNILVRDDTYMKDRSALYKVDEIFGGYTGKISMLSVNCVPDNAKFEKLSKYDIVEHTYYEHPKHWVSIIDEHIDHFYSDKEVSNEKISRAKDNAKKAFLNKWLINVPVVRSNDYSSRNEGMLVTDNSIWLGPALDLEYLCTVIRLDDYMIKDALKYVREEIPQDYDRTISKVKESLVNDSNGRCDIDRVVESAIKEKDTEYSNFFATRIKNNCQELINYHEAVFGKEADAENSSPAREI